MPLQLWLPQPPQAAHVICDWQVGWSGSSASRWAAEAASEVDYDARKRDGAAPGRKRERREGASPEQRGRHPEQRRRRREEGGGSASSQQEGGTGNRGGKTGCGRGTCAGHARDGRAARTVGLRVCAACVRGSSNSGGWGGVDKPEEGRAVVAGGAPAPDSSAPAAEERRGKAACASWAAAMAAARANSKPLALIPY
jgi:hypothetical protein